MDEQDTVPERPGYMRIDGIQEPEDGSGCATTYAWLSIRDLQECHKLNPWKAQNLRAAKEVLCSPARIFQHIRPDERESGWCYSGVPQCLWDEHGHKAGMPANHVFTVYLNSGCVVFEWGPETVDREDPGSPIGARTGLGTEIGRFGRLAWTRNP
jgi:hypothetical protein